MVNKLKERGFTLIELLVVIAIIGILSSVVLASLNTAREKSRDAKRVSDIGQIQLALELYFDSNGGYPSAISELVTDGLLPSAPVPPTGTTDTAYSYKPLNTGCTGYVVGTLLEDDAHTVLDSADNTVHAAGSNLTCPDGTYTAAALDCSVTARYCVTN